MKRLAVLTLTAALAWSGSPIRAADAVPLPLPTGFAPTSPRVAAPVIVDGEVLAAGDAPRARLRDRLGMGGGVIHAAGGECDGGKCGPRPKSRLAGLVPCGGLGGGVVHAKPQWCSDCAPAVRHPLPPLPAGVGGWVEDAPVGGRCAAGDCDTGKSGDCCAKLMAWLCFRQTPVHFPCTPSLRQPPLYTYFNCRERPGCATGACATAVPAAECAAVAGRGLPARGVAGCVTCPQPGEGVMPGYRFARPEAPAVTQWSPAPGPVTTTAFKEPVSGMKKPPATGAASAVKTYPQK